MRKFEKEYYELDAKYKNSGAIFSDDMKYRHLLWRIWDNEKPKVLWFLHNPSVADAFVDDPTVRRCVNFSKGFENNKYGGMYILNMIDYIATNPKDLLKLHSSELTVQDEKTKEIIQELIVFGIGNLHIAAYGNPIVGTPINTFPKRMHALKLTKEGNPCHPLYLKGDLQPKLISELMEQK